MNFDDGILQLAQFVVDGCPMDDFGRVEQVKKIALNIVTESANIETEQVSTWYNILNQEINRVQLILDSTSDRLLSGLVSGDLVAARNALLSNRDDVKREAYSELRKHV